MAAEAVTVALVAASLAAVEKGVLSKNKLFRLNNCVGQLCDPAVRTAIVRYRYPLSFIGSVTRALAAAIIFYRSLGRYGR